MVLKGLPLFQELIPLSGRKKWGVRRATLAEFARKEELSPDHPPEDFDLHVMGKNWVTWPLLAARVSGTVKAQDFWPPSWKVAKLDMAVGLSTNNILFFFF